MRATRDRTHTHTHTHRRRHTLGIQTHVHKGQQAAKMFEILQIAISLRGKRQNMKQNLWLYLNLSLSELVWLCLCATVCVWVCVHNQPDIISQRIFSSNVQNGWTTSVVRWFLEMSETAEGKGEWQRERGGGCSEKKRDRGNKNSSQTRRQPKSAKKLANENEKLPSKCKKKRKIEPPPM